MKIGANYLGSNRCEFRVWAPLRQQVALDILTPEPRQVPLEKEPGGYWSAIIEAVAPGSRYQYRLDDELTRPDPASRRQPDVHGPSEVIDVYGYNWGDGEWRGLPLQDYVLYELHVGTFTPAGTFAAIIPRLPVLKALGVTALSLMPVAQCPGDRNWGYDGVYPYAVQHSFGTPQELQQLVDACHQQGLAVVLDVVYNHFGPEGNYTADFGPYFTHRYNTPWGAAINYDDAHSDGVRHFAIENALYWLRDFHFDGLRLDAVHAIFDFGARHILAEMKSAVEAMATTRSFPAYLIAESDLNDPRLLRSHDQGGYSLDAQWCDDFHHSLHALLTGEHQGYYEDFGQLQQMAKALEDSFVYDWVYSPHRRRYHGEDTRDRPPTQFVVCTQNHDQVGNRMLGERLSTLVSLEALKLAAGTLLLSPYVPMLFMGEEYGETHPFLYFISHGDENLVAAVREGRKREFAAFHDLGEPPDAADIDTVERSRLQWELRDHGHHGVLWRFYQTLLQLRKEIPALRHSSRHQLTARVLEPSGILCLSRWHDSSQITAFFNFQPIKVEFSPILGGNWQKRLDSAGESWLGPGTSAPAQLSAGTICLSPHSFVLYGGERS